MSETTAGRDDLTGRTGDVEWQTSYDRATVERFLADAAAQRVQLERRLDEARARVDRARGALEQRDAARSAELAAMVAEAHRQLSALESEHRAAVEAVRSRARDDVAHVHAGAPRPTGSWGST